MPQVDIIQLLKQDGGEKFYPVTHIDAVIGWKDASFFEKVDNGNGGISIKLKSEYEGLWADGWIASGGVGSGGGGGGGGGNAILINGPDYSSLTVGSVSADFYTKAQVDALISGGGTVITDYGKSLSLSTTETYLTDSNGNFLLDSQGRYLVTSLGTTSINLLSETGTVLSSISLPTAQVNGLSVTVGSATIQLGGSASLSQIGVPEWAQNDQPTLYIGTTQVQTQSRGQALEGITSFKLSSVNSTVEWDGANGAWHFLGNVYADGWIASGGTGSGSVSIVGIDDLSDVSLSSPSNGQALIYRSGSWTNETISSGGSTVSVENLASTSAQISRIAKITVDGTDTYLYNDVAWGTYDSTSKTVSVTINGTTRTLCVDGYNSGGGGGGSYSAGSGIDITNSVISLKTASNSTLGGIKLGYSGSGKNYPVELDSNDRAYVSVPWEGGSGGGGGTVTSVGISVPSFMSVTNSPVTTAGTMAISFSSQAKNKVLASPVSASGAPSFRVLNTADIPDLSGTYVTLSGDPQTIEGAKTFTTNPITIDSTSGISVNASSYIDIGDARLVYDNGSKALHVTYRSGTGETIGLFADGFVSSGGTAASSTIRFVTVDGGDQTISGDKTFNDDISVLGSASFAGISSSGSIVVNGVTLSGSSTKLSVNKNTEFSGITNVTGGKISIQDIVNRIIALES